MTPGPPHECSQWGPVFDFKLKFKKIYFNIRVRASLNARTDTPPYYAVRARWKIILFLFVFFCLFVCQKETNFKGGTDGENRYRAVMGFQLCAGNRRPLDMTCGKSVVGVRGACFPRDRIVIASLTSYYFRRRVFHTENVIRPSRTRTVLRPRSARLTFGRRVRARGVTRRWRVKTIIRPTRYITIPNTYT